MIVAGVGRTSSSIMEPWVCQTMFWPPSEYVGQLIFVDTVQIQVELSLTAIIV
jgi:hypothetical protein